MLLPVCCACWVSRWAEEHNKLFVASVGPGYDDSKIRPWVSVLSCRLQPLRCAWVQLAGMCAGPLITPCASNGRQAVMCWPGVDAAHSLCDTWRVSVCNLSPFLVIWLGALIIVSKPEILRAPLHPASLVQNAGATRPRQDGQRWAPLHALHTGITRARHLHCGCWWRWWCLPAGTPNTYLGAHRPDSLSPPHSRVCSIALPCVAQPLTMLACLQVPSALGGRGGFRCTRCVYHLLERVW